METFVWIGSALTAAGFVGIIWSIVLVSRARRAGLDEDDLRARLQKVVPLNIGALLLSMLGLMMVIVGVILS
jgi:hypothetical protein